MRLSEPTPQTTGCPPRDTLLDFARGNIPEAGLEAIAGHLSSCAGCLSALAEIQRGVSARQDARLREYLQAPDRPPGGGAPEGETPAPNVSTPVPGLGTPGRYHRGAVRSVGSYALLEEIGAGGMGVVYRAELLPVGQVAAVKVLSDRSLARPGRLARFRTEGTALGRLHHPNVVRLYHFGEHDGVPYYSMELAEGGSLAARLRGGPLPAREAAELVRTLAGAVAHAHEIGVLHRDLKPGNVLFDRDGTPKVADFGLAKVLGGDAEPLTDTGSVLGTPNYMAPEQADGRAAEIDRRTDVYGLGAILYEAVTGKPPYAGADAHDTLRLVREARLEPPSGLAPGTPPWLEAICLRCLERSPSRRYPSARDLADDLARWLRDERPHTVPGVLGTAWRATRRRAAAVTAVAVLAAAAGAVYLLDPDRPLRRIQAALDRGEPAVLIPDRGAPDWLRVRAGGERTPIITAADGTFTVDSWDLCLVELCPDPGRDRYRFRVSVRHANSDDNGFVGGYAGLRAFPGHRRETALFVGMVYNDVRSAADLLKRAPPHLLPKQPVPPENWVHLGVGVVGEQAPGVAWEVKPHGVTGAPFLPRGVDGDVWHELDLDVSPEGVRGAWDGRPVGHMTAQDATTRLTNQLDYMRTKRRDNPLLAGIVPAYAPRGGVGLILYRGSASFRSAIISPVPQSPSPF